MAEELETGLESEEEQAAVEEEQEYTEIELEAMDQGWSPHGVEGKRNLSAEEFLDRKPLYDKIHRVEKTLKEQDKKFEALRQHEKMVRDRMHEDHLKELKAAKRAALESYDYEKAEQIDDEIFDARTQHQQEEKPAVPDVENIQRAVADWTEENPWYMENKVMKRFAYGEGEDYRAENPGAPIEEILAHISKAVKKEFPEKFSNMNRAKPSSVEGSATGGRRTPATPKQKSVKDLPEEAISVMRTLIRGGTFKTEQDYVNDYFNQK